MRFALPAILLALVAGTGAVAAPPTSDATASFRLGDGSIACAYESGTILCATSGVRATVVLERDGDSRATRRNVAWDASTPALRRTESWWHDGFTCKAQAGGLQCATVSGGAIFVTLQRGGGIR